MSDDERTDYRARRMGFVFQFYNLMPILSAVENVELPLLVARVTAREAAARRSRPSRWSGWPSAPRTFPTSCRAASASASTIARALVNDPAIVWADEPTGDLDSENADEIVALDAPAQPGARPDVPDRHPRHLGRPRDGSHRAHARRRDRRGSSSWRRGTDGRPRHAAEIDAVRIEHRRRARALHATSVVPALREQAGYRGRATC